MFDREAGTFSGCGCLVWLAVIASNLTLGGMSVNYLLEVWFGRNISWIGDVVIGLFVAELSVPAVIVTWLLRYFGAI